MRIKYKNDKNWVLTFILCYVHYVAFIKQSELPHGRSKGERKWFRVEMFSNIKRFLYFELLY